MKNTLSCKCRCAKFLYVGFIFSMLNTMVFATEYPLSVEHRYGTSVISKQPKRVATLDWAGEDNLLALGYQPLTVRYWFGEFDNGIWPWAQSYLTSAPEIIRGEINYEQIASTHPDLIIAIRSGISKEDYEQLSKIAPVVATPNGYGDYTLSWEERARILGKVLNKEEEAENKIANIQAKLLMVKESHPDWKGKTLAMATYWNGNIGAYSAEDITVRLKTEMGLEVTQGIKDITNKGEFYIPLSEEKLSLIDADVLFWYTVDGAKEEIESLVLRPYMRAFKEGREIFLPTNSIINGALSHGSLLSIPLAIDKVVPMIEQAIDGDKSTRITYE